jgi:hypothetical protein
VTARDCFPVDLTLRLTWLICAHAREVVAFAQLASRPVMRLMRAIARQSWIALWFRINKKALLTIYSFRCPQNAEWESARQTYPFHLIFAARACREPNQDARGSACRYLIHWLFVTAGIRHLHAIAVAPFS